MVLWRLLFVLEGSSCLKLVMKVRVVDADEIEERN